MPSSIPNVNEFSVFPDVEYVVPARLIDLTSSVAQRARERRIRHLEKPKIH